MLREATLCFPVRGHPPAQVLLGLKKTGLGAGKLNGFGGKLEPGETAAEAAARELREESGVQAHGLQPMAHLTFYFPARPEWDQIVHVFLAHQWEGEPVESREMRPEWFEASAIPFDRMWADDAHWLPLVLQGQMVRAAFTFQADNEAVAAAEIRPWRPDDASPKGES